MGKCWLDQKTIVITGASSGIGKYLSQLFISKHNCHVIGIGCSADKMQKFVCELRELSKNFEYRLFDVSDENSWIEFANDYKDKDIDILINNAGVLPPFESFEHSINVDKDVNPKDKKSITIGQNLRKTMDINFMSVLYGVTYFSPIIEKSPTPAIINIASSAGLCALPGTTIYSASKAAVKNFTECLACEKDYYVGLVCPGFTKTDIFRNQVHSMDNKLINLIATSLPKMAKKIYKGIKNKKRRMVFGMDARFMDWSARHFPNSAPKFMTKILKSAKVELFNDVFNKENEK